MTFEELVNSWNSEKDDISKLFGEVQDNGYNKGPFTEKQVLEAARFMNKYLSGKVSGELFSQSMTSSDFPILFGQVIDRKMLGDWAAFTPSYRPYVDYQVLNDFRTADRYYTDGLDGVLDKVEEDAEIKFDSLTEGKYSISVGAYGRGMSISWQSRINDDMGAFQKWPSKFVSAADRTGLRLVTGEFVDGSGPHASFYTAGNDNIIPSNPALSPSAIRTGIKTMLAQTSPVTGEPIEIANSLYLVVPDSLWMEAEDILATKEFRRVDGTDVYIQSGNGIPMSITAIRNPYISKIASVANGDTSWFLFNDPNQGRPALGVAGLRGHEAPDLFMKAPDRIRVSGSGLDGDFATGAQKYGVLYVVGAARMEPRATVASNGSGV